MEPQGVTLPDEPNIVINGVQLNQAQAMTLRVALGSFLFSLTPKSLGNDKHGKTMVELYKKNAREVSVIMHKHNAREVSVIMHKHVTGG